MPKILIGKNFEAKSDAIKALLKEDTKIDVNFLRSNYDKAGFDDFKNSAGVLITYYDDYKTFDYDGEKKTIIWKTMRKDVEDHLTISTQVIGVDKVFLDFDASKFTTAPPLKPSSPFYAFDMKTSIGDDAPTNELVISAHLNKKDGVKAAECRVNAYSPKKINLKVVILNKYNDDIQAIGLGKKADNKNINCVTYGDNEKLDTKPQGDDKIYTYPDGRQSITVGEDLICQTKVSKTFIFDSKNLEEELNKVYKQINVTWEITYFDKVLVYYDAIINGGNDNGVADIKDGITTEYSFIIKEVQKVVGEALPKKDRIAIIVNEFDDSGAVGLTIRGGQFAFVKLKQDDNEVMQTIIHELGHTLNLEDLTTQFASKNATKEDDKTNVMTYSYDKKASERLIFRKFQWTTLRSFMTGKFNP